MPLRESITWILLGLNGHFQWRLLAILNFRINFFLDCSFRWTLIKRLIIGVFLLFSSFVEIRGQSQLRLKCCGYHRVKACCPFDSFTYLTAALAREGCLHLALALWTASQRVVMAFIWHHLRLKVRLISDMLETYSHYSTFVAVNGQRILILRAYCALYELWVGLLLGFPEEIWQLLLPLLSNLFRIKLKSAFVRDLLFQGNLTLKLMILPL